MDIERLNKQVDFCREIDKEKNIGRQTYLSDGKRKENDAEHAWHMAVMALVLSEYANEKIDLLKTISMLLIHDLVEIDAGDTYCYDEEAKKSQQAREQAGAERLFSMLPKEQAQKFYDLWREFEEVKTPEAKFARTLDCFQPMMLNVASGGKSWMEHSVKLSQLIHRNEHTPKGSKTLWQYALDNFIMPNVENGKIKNPKE